MADALTGVTEIDAASLAEISNVTQMYLQQASILVPTVSDFSYLAGKGTKSIAVPRMGGFTVNDKEENTSVDAQTSTVSSDTITLEKHKVIQFLVEEIAEGQSKIPYVVGALERAAKDLAAQVDTDIITELKLASASTPDHQIVFIDTTNDVIAKGDILAARKLLRAQYVPVNECYIGIGSEKEAEMLALSDFIVASNFGSADPIQNGVLGKVYGMKVVVHEGFSDFMCVWHPSAVGIAFQRQATVQTQPDLANLAERWSIDQRYGVEVLDSGKRTVLVDSTN